MGEIGLVTHSPGAPSTAWIYNYIHYNGLIMECGMKLLIHS